MAQKKRASDPTKEEWRAFTAWIKLVCDLDLVKFRDEATKLATRLESEGHAAHRSADFLEDLSMFKGVARDVRPSDHARSAIVTKLKHWHDERHLRLTEGRLDQLVEVGVRDKLRQQAAVLLDSAELIRTTLRWHEQRLKKLRPLEIGRIPSVAKSEVLLKMREWDVGATEMSARLHEGGIRGKSYKPRSLTSDRSRKKK